MKQYPGLARLRIGLNFAASQPGSVQSSRAKPRTTSRQTSNVPFMVFKASRLIDEMNTPAASEKNSVLASSSIIRQNSPADTPPISKVSAMIGKIASSPYAARSELESNLPSTMSYPRRSVRNNRPNVPSRFSSLRQSEVRNTPARQTQGKLIHFRNPNRAEPGTMPRAFFETSMTVTMPAATRIASTAAATRDQYVIPRRDATRNSRFTMGRNVMLGK